MGKGFAREIGLHRAHFHLLIRRQAIPSLGQTGDATVEGRLLQIPSLNLNLHPIDELLAEFVEGVLRRLWLLRDDQLQPRSRGKVVIFEFRMIRPHLNGDPLGFLPFNANTPARCPRRRLLFTKALIILLDFHKPSSQVGASSASAFLPCPLVAIGCPDGASFELPATSTENDPSGWTRTAPG